MKEERIRISLRYLKIINKIKKLNFMPRGGFEPPIPRSSVWCVPGLRICPNRATFYAILAFIWYFSK